MKFCKDCTHYDYWGTNNEWCTHPNNGISMVNGLKKRQLPHVNRAYSSKCGEDAKWFEPIVVVTSPTDIDQPSIIDKFISSIKNWFSTH